MDDPVKQSDSKSSSAAVTTRVRKALLSRWVDLILRHRVLVLCLTIIMTAAMGYVVYRLPLMTSLTDMLSKETDLYRGYTEARDEFGGDELIVLAVRSDEHFTKQGLDKLRHLTDLLGNHPFVERATSFLNGGTVRSNPLDPEEIITTSYNQADIAPPKLKELVTADPLFRRITVSADGTSALITVRLQATHPNSLKGKLLEELKRRAANMHQGTTKLRTESGQLSLFDAIKQEISSDFRKLAIDAGYPKQDIHMSGFPVLITSLLQETERNIKELFPFCMVVLFLLLLYLFRRLVDSFLPILCIFPAVIWSIGLGGLVIGHISIITSAAPIIILVVGTSNVVHLVTQFRHEMGRGAERSEAIRAAFMNVGTACMLTSLTTLIGFASMFFQPMPYTRELALYAFVGVICAFLLTFMLTPVLLSFTRSVAHEREQNRTERLSVSLRFMYRLVARHTRKTAALGVLLTIASICVIPFITVENVLTNKLHKDHPIRHDLEQIQEAFGSSGDFEILVKTGKEGGLYDTQVLHGMYQLQVEMEKSKYIEGSLSIVDLVELAYGLFEAPDYLKGLQDRGAPPLPPETRCYKSEPDGRCTDSEPGRNISAQLDKMFLANFDGMDAFVDEQRQFGRMVVRVPNMSAERLVIVADQISRMAKPLFPENVSVQPNGFGLLCAVTGPEILDSSIRGLSTALLIIALLMALLFGSLRVGLLSVIPNVLPVAFAVWFTYLWAGAIDADGLTMLTVCVCIAVDDTIHFLARYHIERDRGLEIGPAVERTMMESGYGMLRTSIILVGGFSVLLMGDYMTLVSMGIMFCVTLSLAVLLDLTVMPAMAHLRWFERGSTKKTNAS